MKNIFNSSNSTKKGFTLIELMVVISIIAMLSSIVIVSLNTAREKARISRAKMFETNIYHTIGYGPVAFYDFETGSGSTAVDVSGNKNDATMTNSPTFSTDTYDSYSKFSMNFANTQYLSLTKGLGISNSNFTVSLWIKTTSTNDSMYVFSSTGGANGYRFGLSAGRIAFLIGNDPATYTEQTCGQSTLNDGKWHNIVGEFDRTGGHIFRCFLDGKPDGSSALLATDPISYPNMYDSVLFIGSNNTPTNSGYSFTGNLDNVRIYSQNLSGISIENIYNAEKSQFAVK